MLSWDWWQIEYFCNERVQWGGLAVNTKMQVYGREIVFKIVSSMNWMDWLPMWSTIVCTLLRMEEEINGWKGGWIEAWWIPFPIYLLWKHKQKHRCMILEVLFLRRVEQNWMKQNRTEHTVTRPNEADKKRIKRNSIKSEWIRIEQRRIKWNGTTKKSNETEENKIKWIRTEQYRIKWNRTKIESHETEHSGIKLNRIKSNKKKNRIK